MLRKLLTVAHFDDVDSMHKARLLNSISLLLAVIMGVLLVVTLFTPILAVRWPLAAALLMVCGIQVLLRQKKLNAASWLLIAVIWTLIAQDVLLFSGMRGRYFGMFTVVIFLAFVLLPNRNWWFVVIASCVVGVLAVLFEQSLGLTFGTGQQDSLLEAFLTEMGGLIVSVLLFTITYRQKSRLLAEAEVTNAELARSVEALGLGEARFRSLIQNAAEAIIVVDIEKRNIVDANQRAVELFGYSRDELLAFAPLLIETANQSETNDGVDFLTTLAERVMAGETVIFERTYLHADGYKLIAEARFTRLPSEHGQLMRGSLIDVSERVAATNAVNQSLRDLQLLHQIASNAAHEPQEKIRQMLQLGCQRFGFPMAVVRQHDNDSSKPVAVVGADNTYFAAQPAVDAFHLQLAEADDPLYVGEMALSAEFQHHPQYTKHNVAALFGAAVKADGIYYGSIEFLSQQPRAEHIRPMDIELIKLMAQWIGGELARMRVEESRSSLMDQLQLVINSLPARVGYADTEERILFINERFREAGFDPQDAVGKRLNELFPAEAYAELEPYIQIALSGQPVSFEQTFDRLGGTLKHATVSYLPHFEDGTLTGFFAIALDITQLRETEHALNEAQKMESLGVLAGGIAHDFNNLLVAMLGQSSLAKAKLATTHPARKHVEKSISAAERAALLTQQMLAYSGRGQFEIRRINLNRLISDNLDLFVASIPKSVELETKFLDELPTIEADSAQMQQVVMNLLINAAQAIGDRSGSIAITTGVITIDEDDRSYWQYTGDQLQRGTYVSLTITDTGGGMDDETRQRIFDPFFTTKSTGSGLGLAAVVGIMRGHGGGIHVRSRVGKGTTFTLLFKPVAADYEQLEAFDSAETDAQFSHAAQPILVIDDEPVVLELIQDVLATENMPCMVASSGAEGVALYEQHMGTISLVLLDLSMPGLNGEETYNRLKSLDPNVRVILSSGYNQHEATCEFVAQGLVDFIQKPYDVNTLAAKLKEHLKPVLVPRV